eukprot:scaffold160766_cov27-Tisochrysis_lutea.AAC.2
MRAFQYLQPSALLVGLRRLRLSVCGVWLAARGPHLVVGPGPPELADPRGILQYGPRVPRLGE